jgi:hypothetical protein
MPKSDPFITADPHEAAVGDSVTLTWGDLPSQGQTVNLQFTTTCGNGGTLVTDLYTSSTRAYALTCAGTTEFSLVQGNKVLASVSVTAT